MGSPFVSVDPTAPRFLLNGAPFYFAGTSHYVVAALQNQGAVCSPTTSCATAQLDAMVASGVKVLRMPAHRDCMFNSPGAGCIQVGPNTYNETSLAVMDWVIAQAAMRGLHVVLWLSDNWKDRGGAEQIVRWTVPQNDWYHDRFYTNQAAKDLYKQNIANLLNRVNTITGVAYKDDPTIMSWELLQDARCQGVDMSTSGTCTTTMIRDWAAEMVAYVKQLDPKHMVALGDEGFVDKANGAYPNVASAWYSDGSTGDFKEYLEVPGVDYGGAKWYPTYWGLTPNAGEGWITDHAAVAASVGKPFVLTEYAFPRNGRAMAFSMWHAAALSSNTAGTMVWNVQADPYPDYDGFGVLYPGDMSDQDVRVLLVAHSAAMAAK